MNEATRRQLRAEITSDEGRRTKPYDDKTGRTVTTLPSGGKLTIGVGWNLSDVELPDEIVERMLDIAIDRAETTARRIFPDLDAYSQNRQCALISLAFNMGESRFRSFTETIPLIRVGKWDQAADHIKASAWATQVQPSRRDRIVKQIRNG